MNLIEEKIENFEREEEKTIEVILEILEFIKENDQVDESDMKKVVEISLNIKISNELFTE